MEVIGIAFETFKERQDGVVIPYFLRYEDDSLDSTELLLFVSYQKYLPGFKGLEQSQKLFALAKFLENPGEEICYQIAMEVKRTEKRKAS
jgi:hypothetical protein